MKGRKLAIGVTNSKISLKLVKCEVMSLEEKVIQTCLLQRKEALERQQHQRDADATGNKSALSFTMGVKQLNKPNRS